MLPGLPILSRQNTTVLSRAVARWRAGNYDATRDALIDESGNGLHARLGSTVGADTNDPLRLPYTGKHVYFPGAAGNYASTPDSVPTSITGDIDIRVKLEHATWRPAADEDLVAKYLNTGNQRSFIFKLVGPSGVLQLITSVDGTAVVGPFSSVAVPVVNGPQWVRVTRQASALQVIFYTSTDGVSWTQLGTTVACLNTALFDSTAVLEIGSDNTGAGGNITGKIYYAELRSGIGGSVVASFDAAQLSEPYTSWTNPSTGEVWTLNRATTGRKLCVVDRNLLLFGTDDYLEIPDSPLLNIPLKQPFSIVLFVRQYATPPNFARFLCKRTAATDTLAGYVVYNGNAGLKGLANVGDGTSNIATAQANITPGVASLVGFTIGASLLKMIIGAAFAASAANTLAATSSNAAVLRIGTESTSLTQVDDMEFFGAAVFREELTQNDLNRLTAEMGALS